MEELERLARLRADGHLSEDEFRQAKAKVLAPRRTSRLAVGVAAAVVLLGIGTFAVTALARDAGPSASANCEPVAESDGCAEDEVPSAVIEAARGTMNERVTWQGGPVSPNCLPEGFVFECSFPYDTSRVMFGMAYATVEYDADTGRAVVVSAKQGPR